MVRAITAILLPTVLAFSPALHLRTAQSPATRTAPPRLDAQDVELPSDPVIRQKIFQTQAENQKKGIVAFSAVLAVSVWLFTVPPDIRRERDLGALAGRVVEHYSTCGRSATAPACFKWDLSIDPKSRQAFDANVEALGVAEPVEAVVGAILGE